MEGICGLHQWLKLAVLHTVTIITVFNNDSLTSYLLQAYSQECDSSVCMLC